MARKSEVANIMMLKMIDLVSNVHNLKASGGQNSMSLSKESTIQRATHFVALIVTFVEFHEQIKPETSEKLAMLLMSQIELLRQLQ